MTRGSGAFLSGRTTRPREYVKERMPRKSPFVKPEEGVGAIASEEFRNFALTEKLTGIKFEESGVFV